jgi:2,4-dienoyl-CoA reductase-like NADH-dependent reductase (Old Yellow Enzyme family)
MSALFDPLFIGDLKLKNRIIMAPLTRQRSGESRVPNELMKTYYEQRASAGLILTEATCIHPTAVGYKNTPGLWNDEQVAGWQKITDTVNLQGGIIFSQLWHVGRISDPSFLGGETPVAPSAIKPAGTVSHLYPKKEFVTPRALKKSEIKTIVNWFQLSALNAKKAGFDGVEVHAANGYLIDQFLQSKTNQRTDEYGGSLENRARFLLEIIEALTEVWPAQRIGVHLAPACDAHDMGDANPLETFSYVARELGKKKIAFLFLREPQRSAYLTPSLKKEFQGVIIANQDLTVSQGLTFIQQGVADAISWGKLFISNPDLPKRIKEDLPLQAFDPHTFYSDGPKGYTDYPFAP